MTLSRELAEWCLSHSMDAIEEADWTAAKQLLLDALGCALAGCRAEGCREVAGLMRDWGGRPDAVVLFSDDRLPMPNAAFANSMLVHAQDFDDVYLPGTLHISSIVVPAMLAAAGRQPTTGRRALMSMILGVEAAARIEAPGRYHRRGQGFLPTSLAGSFGGVMTAAYLLGLDAEQCVQAMGINYAQLSGNRQALYDSTLTKRMQPAMAARSALWSTALAQRGITGPDHALEGEAGYYQLYLDMPEPPAPGSLAQPAEAMQIRRISFKPYPSCGVSHATQVAAEQLREEEQLKPEDIAQVELFGLDPGGIVTRPFSIGSNPQVDAQFSVAWAVAHTLLRGRARLADYQADRVAADQAVIELAQSITYTSEPDLPPHLPIPEGYNIHNVMWKGLFVTTRDGRKLMRYACPAVVAAPGNFDGHQSIEKFNDCADFSGLCSPSQARQIIEQVMTLDQAEDLTGLFASLRLC